MATILRWTIGLVAMLAAGCGVDSGDSSPGGSAGSAGSGDTGGGGAGGGKMCPDDPADGPVLPECGIWVSASQGDDANAGTQAAPVATLMQAVALAEEGLGRVYACNEEWTGPLVVPGSVSLHGGFDCANGWTYMGKEAERAKLKSPAPIGLTWIAGGVDPRPFLTDFNITTADAVEPGDSSIGVFISAAMTTTISRCEIIAGNGADGLDGAPGDPNDEPAAVGAAGGNGQNACSAPVSKGGVPSETSCDDGASKGGKGGDGGLMIAESGANGEPAAEPPAGLGGVGEQLAPKCTGGSPGAAGDNGLPGLGGAFDDVHLTVDGYVGAPGKHGGPGKPGQGGGGGGATFGSAAVCGAASPGGAAGGAGGSGGCGGKPGAGGQAGGASFGVASFSTETQIYDSHVVAGNGGHGGRGGAPQQGGAGGDGGQGGLGAGTIKPGCPGGSGGQGGWGGWGGGGSGGWVTAIVFRGRLAVGATNTTYEYGVQGEGGIGDPMNPDSEGADGNLGAIGNVPP